MLTKTVTDIVGLANIFRLAFVMDDINALLGADLSLVLGQIREGCFIQSRLGQALQLFLQLEGHCSKEVKDIEGVQ